MALDWMKWVKGLARRREVLAMARRLNSHRKMVASSCMEVWEWFDDESSDGSIRGITCVDVDNIAETAGFTEAMIEQGWMAQDGDTIRCVRWGRHNSGTAKKRAANTARQQARRGRDSGATIGATNARPHTRPEGEKKESSGMDGSGVLTEPSKTKARARVRAGVDAGASPEPQGASDGKPQAPGSLAQFHVEPEALGSIGRLMEIFDDCVAAGRFPRTEPNRLAFVAAAELCKRKGRKPAAMFASHLREWPARNKNVTAKDEERARQRLAEYDADNFDA